ncbi:Transcriptional regulator [hydrothermal vent metagenome]|uniref:Transcriptional regulator n=1 Tax=hydrothermal vent metagenome TaxID=652676 RepID=A0A3B0RNF7_9ZZZZ
MVKKNPNPIDVHVGNRVRMRRMLVGMSQEKLGDALGLTFQQVQKYEKGANRVSASRLYQMASTLGVPIQFFFDDMPLATQNANSDGLAESNNAGLLMDFLNSSEGFQLGRAFSTIEDPNVRRKVLELVKSLSTKS